MKNLGRFRTNDRVPSRRCGDAEPVAVYEGVDYVVHIDPDTCNIEIFGRPKPSRRATADDDVERPLNEQLREIDRRNAEFWQRRKENDDK
jgi:hypothetical protein